MATPKETQLIDAMMSLTVQLKRIADIVERDQKKSIIEQRKEKLNKEKNELLSDIKRSGNGDAGRD